MKKYATLFEKGDHKWTVFYHDAHKADFLIGTNEYLIQNGGKALVTDPGGTEVFPEIISAISNVSDINEIDQIFCSHQDPDIFSACALWFMMKPELKIFLPKIWIGFMLHFGGKLENFEGIGDQGGTINVGGLALQMVPAHYLHSSGNFHLYDPIAKVLFTGDTGAAMTGDPNGFVVKDFDAHIPHMEGFHKRWFGSNDHKNQWCENVRSMEIDFLCPQHGLVFEGPMVHKFIDWLYDLRVGVID